MGSFIFFEHTQFKSRLLQTLAGGEPGYEAMLRHIMPCACFSSHHCSLTVVGFSGISYDSDIRYTGKRVTVVITTKLFFASFSSQSIDEHRYLF